MWHYICCDVDYVIKLQMTGIEVKCAASLYNVMVTLPYRLLRNRPKHQF